MKKSFNYYMVIWAILLVIYNLIVFLVKPIIPGYVIHYDARFWISWGAIIATFAGQLLCAKTAFNSKNNEKFFLNIPLITESYTALLVATLAGSILMLIPGCPAWIAAIVCAAVLAFSVISIVKAKVAADVVSDIEDKVKTQTAFIKTLTMDAESLMSQTKNADFKTEIKKVYETVRYSDPMSGSELSNIENQITLKFYELKNSVALGNAEAVVKEAAVLVELIGERNRQCRLLK